VGIIGWLQGWLFFALVLGAFALEVWALVHALRQPAGAFTAAGKRTKQFWGIVLAANVALGFLALPGGPFYGGFLGLILVIPAAIYLTDVRPAVSGYGRRGGGSRGGGWGGGGW